MVFCDRYAEYLIPLLGYLFPQLIYQLFIYQSNSTINFVKKKTERSLIAQALKKNLNSDICMLPSERQCKMQDTIITYFDFLHPTQLGFFGRLTACPMLIEPNKIFK